MYAPKSYKLSVGRPHFAEEEAEAFYTAIGRAVVTWQRLEAQMAYVYSFLLASRAGVAASAAFYHIKNDNLRHDMLDVAARHSLSGSTLGEWRELSARLTTAIAMYHRIGHCETDEEMAETGWTWRIQPPGGVYSRFDPLDRSTPASGAADKLRLKKIGEATQMFAELSRALNSFALKLFVLYNSRKARALSHATNGGHAQPRSQKSTEKGQRAKKKPSS